MDKSLVKGQPGRPTKIDEACIKKLIAAFQLGCNIQTACEYAQISPVIYYARLKEDEDFLNEMNSAKNYCRLLASSVVMEAVKNKDIKAAQWWLEHKHADEFGGRPVIEIDNRHQEMRMDFVGLDGEEIEIR